MYETIIEFRIWKVEVEICDAVIKFGLSRLKFAKGSSNFEGRGFNSCNNHQIWKVDVEMPQTIINSGRWRG